MKKNDCGEPTVGTALSRIMGGNGNGVSRGALFGHATGGGRVTTTAAGAHSQRCSAVADS